MSTIQQITNPSFGQSWELDATGNWPGFRQLDVATPGNNLDQQRASNQVNEITGVSQRYGAAWAQPAYDRAGNMTTIPDGNDPTTVINGVYDAWNRLVSVTDESGTTTYSYDGLGRRITQTASGTTRDAYYSDQWQVLEERVSTTESRAAALKTPARRSLVSSTSVDRQFVWGLRYIDDLVLRDRSTTGVLNERLYALQDANWNMIAVASTAGAVQERYRYSPYGVPAFLSASFTPATLDGSYSWETLYCGYRWDADTGLYQVRNRYLNPQLGAWISRDPLAINTIIDKSMETLQTPHQEDLLKLMASILLNLYSYSKQSPMNHNDALGLLTISSGDDSSSTCMFRSKDPCLANCDLPQNKPFDCDATKIGLFIRAECTGPCVPQGGDPCQFEEGTRIVVYVCIPTYPNPFPDWAIASYSDSCS